MSIPRVSASSVIPHPSSATQKLPFPRILIPIRTLPNTQKRETTMMYRTTRAMALAIALVGATAAGANAQQSSTGAVARNHEVKDTTHRAIEPVTPAPDSEKVVATTSVSTGRGHGLMKRATAVAASAAKTIKNAGAKDDAAEAALLAVGTANPGTLMLEEVLRAQQRDHERAAAAQAARQANTDGDGYGDCADVCRHGCHRATAREHGTVGCWLAGVGEYDGAGRRTGGVSPARRPCRVW